MFTTLFATLSKNLKTLILLAFLLLLVIFSFCLGTKTRKAIDEVVTPARPDTVFVGDTLVETIIKHSKGEVHFVDRLLTGEQAPDTVYVSPPSVAPSPYTRLPRYSVQQVEKDGRTLTVEVLDRDSLGGQRLVYTLPREGSDYTLQSGTDPAKLRVERTLGPIQFGAKVTILGGVGIVSGSSDPVVLTTLQGPVRFRSRHFEATPVLIAGGSDSSLRAGVAFSYSIGSF